MPCIAVRFDINRGRTFISSCKYSCQVSYSNFNCDDITWAPLRIKSPAIECMHKLRPANIKRDTRYRALQDYAFLRAFHPWRNLASLWCSWTQQDPRQQRRADFKANTYILLASLMWYTILLKLRQFPRSRWWLNTKPETSLYINSDRTRPSESLHQLLQSFPAIVCIYLPCLRQILRYCFLNPCDGELILWYI